MINYPIIKYPEQIISVINKPLIEPRPILKPQIDFPMKRQLYFEDIPVLLLTPIVGTGAFYGALKGTGLPFLVLLALGLFAWWFTLLNQILNAEAIYKRKKDNYDSITKPYYDRQNEIDDFRRNIKDANWVCLQKQQRMQAMLKEYESELFYYRNKLVGRFELTLFTALKNKYCDKINKDLVLEVFPNDEAYCPDIIYADEEMGLFIDIEIDEPYILRSGEPIHYFRDDIHVDKKRDDYFLDYKWLVIRFSEYQVKKNVTACVNLVALVINKLSQNSMLIENEILETGLEVHKGWDYDGAKEMFNKNLRSKY